MKPLQFSVVLRIVWTGAHVRHPADAYEFLEVLGKKLRSVVRDDSRRLVGELFPRALQDHQLVLLGHRAADLPVHDVAAVAVQDGGEIVKRAVDVDVADIDVPVFMRFLRLNKAGSFL
jgi:hypothetical protein